MNPLRETLTVKLADGSTQEFAAADVEGPATGGKRTGCSCASEAAASSDEGAAGDAEQPPAEGDARPADPAPVAASRPAIKHSSLQATHTSVRSISLHPYATDENRPPESFWRPVDCYITSPRETQGGSERACQRFLGWLCQEIDRSGNRVIDARLTFDHRYAHRLCVPDRQWRPPVKEGMQNDLDLIHIKVSVGDGDCLDCLIYSAGTDCLDFRVTMIADDTCDCSCDSCRSTVG